jgi:hypothetical protein
VLSTPLLRASALRGAQSAHRTRGTRSGCTPPRCEGQARCNSASARWATRSRIGCGNGTSPAHSIPPQPRRSASIVTMSSSREGGLSHFNAACSPPARCSPGPHDLFRAGVVRRRAGERRARSCRADSSRPPSSTSNCAISRTKSGT